MSNQQKSKIILRITGLIMLVVSAFLVINFLDCTTFLISWLEENFSDDHQLNKITVVCIQFINGFLVLLMLVFSVLLLTNTQKVFFNQALMRASQAVRFFIVPEEVRCFFLKDESTRLEKLNLWILIISSLIGFLLHFSILFFGLPKYEGMLEKASAVVLFLSVVLMLLSALKINKIRVLSRLEKRVLFLILFSISIVLFLILGEEVSWGQRIFGWQSTGVFLEQNFQGETNLHNFINPILPLFYPLVGMTSFLILFLYWVFPRKDLTNLQKAIIPPASFFVLFFMMAGASFNGQSELYESLVAMCAFLYSVRVYSFLGDLK